MTTLTPSTTASLSTTYYGNPIPTPIPGYTTRTWPASTPTARDYNLNAGNKKTAALGVFLGLGVGLFVFLFCLVLWLHSRKERKEKAAEKENARGLQEAVVAVGEAEERERERVAEIERRVVAGWEEERRPYVDSSKV